MALQPVIPVLSINRDQITKRDDQLAYLIRHAFNNPGWTSSQIESQLVSMRKLLAEFEHDKDDFVNALKQKLENAAKRLWAYCNVTVTATDISPTQYAVTIAITDDVGQVLMSTDNIRVNGKEIKLNFDKDW